MAKQGSDAADHEDWAVMGSMFPIFVLTVQLPVKSRVYTLVV